MKGNFPDFVTVTREQIDQLGDKAIEQGFRFGCAIANELCEKSTEHAYMIGDVMLHIAGLIPKHEIRKNNNYKP